LIFVRKAEAADVPLILRFLAAMAAEAGESAGSTDASLMAHGFGPTPRFHGLIAEADHPLGMILYFPEYSTWRGEMGLFVQDIYLAPEARGLGLGRKLLAAAMARADWAPQFLTLMVAHDNTAARGFYGSLGLTLRDKADQLILEGEGLRALMQP
jgi:ribosomal protein S18 acetylase RimI-like enzyme